MAAHKLIAVIGGICMFYSVQGAAQSAMGLGKPATEEEIRGWNIEIAPDGKNLPKGGSTIDAGEKLYATQCLACHGAKLEGGIGPALTGGLGSLATDKPLKTVQSYWPYATTLYDYIRRTMPFQSPQSLTNDEVYAVTGYILNVNKLMDRDRPVNAETLKAVKMPNRDGFYLDDRPDTKNQRCMENCLLKP